MLRRSSGTIVGVDFGAPARARDQRRKIIAIEADRNGDKRYRVQYSGLNERLALGDAPPGWSAKELLDELLARPVRVAAFDFPFCVPSELLRDPEFAGAVGERERFMGWRSFSYAVEHLLPLTDPLDFSAFAGWRRKAFWKKRATDREAKAQPPLKDQFQSLFQMTLLGNHMLSKMWASHLYRVVPFGGSNLENEAIEVYPGGTLRILGMTNYKRRPEVAIDCVLRYAADHEIRIDVAPSIIEFCCRYNSGPAGSDHDGADAFVALVTAILYCEGLCRALLPPESRRMVRDVEGAIWAPRPPSESALRRP
jgi:hypothetical protein